jgi:hypothetical protein
MIEYIMVIRFGNGLTDSVFTDINLLHKHNMNMTDLSTSGFGMKIKHAYSTTIGVSGNLIKLFKDAIIWLDNVLADQNMSFMFECAKKLKYTIVNGIENNELAPHIIVRALGGLLVLRVDVISRNTEWYEFSLGSKTNIND